MQAITGMELKTGVRRWSIGVFTGLHVLTAMVAPVNGYTIEFTGRHADCKKIQVLPGRNMQLRCIPESSQKKMFQGLDQQGDYPQGGPLYSRIVVPLVLKLLCSYLCVLVLKETQLQRSVPGWTRWLFFGNIFYGICAVGLSVEASLQQRTGLNDALFYLFLFVVTVAYYNIAYITEKPPKVMNERSVWYHDNRKAIGAVQMVLYAAGVALAAAIVWRLGSAMLRAEAATLLIAAAFPAVAILYYGINHRSAGRVSLRDIGWLKPFFIGFCWAGLVTIYPVIYYKLSYARPYEPDFRTLLLFIKNFMFISLLCILFDIKDYATDYNLRLKTVVVNLGLRRTIFYLIIPLAVLGWGSFLTYASTQAFSMMKILLNTVPFLMLIGVAYSLHRRRSIFYYLAIIDGLMLVKAVCGTLAMLYF